MKILWDEPKRLANIVRHRLDFNTLTEAFFTNAIVVSAKHVWFQAIGVDANGIVSVVFAVLGLEGISVISMRPASKNERKLFNAKD